MILILAMGIFLSVIWLGICILNHCVDNYEPNGDSDTGGSDL